MDKKFTVLVIGAHPDDCEIKVGGLGIKCVEKGYRVIFMSATNGETGHQTLSNEETTDPKESLKDPVIPYRMFCDRHSQQ